MQTVDQHVTNSLKADEERAKNTKFLSLAFLQTLSNMYSAIRFFAFMLLLPLTIQQSNAETNKYRLMWRQTPSSTMVIGWHQTSGSNPVVYYDTIDHGTNHNQYQFQHTPDRSVNVKGMDNRFARLTGLQPDTKYYFVIQDSEGNSDRYWFETLPDDPTKPLSIVAGGDSRNNRTPRKNANRMVRKLRPDLVTFAGDFTEFSFNFQWQNWLDDWQLTIAQDGRMTPIVPTRGNHEYSGGELTNLFDVPNPDQYYALTFGGSLLRMYTLNTEIAITGNQANWLQNDLATYEDSVDWLFAQYHKPMRPHVSSKPEKEDVRNSWGQMFHDYGVNLVIECDAHAVKSTWPIRPTYQAGHDEGFVRDDKNGTVYIGEGCWGAPLRNNDDDKKWTRNSGSFNQIKWIWVRQDTVQIRTVKTDNAQSVASVSDSTRFTPPQSLDIWHPSNGKVIYLTNPALYPEVSIDNPKDSLIYKQVKGTNIRAKASDGNGSITQVAFYVDGNLISTDQSPPYTTYWPFSGEGKFTLTAKATNKEGYTSKSNPVTIGVEHLTSNAQVQSADDDAEQGNNGFVDLNSSDLELTEDNGNQQTVGIRFKDVHIPDNARITNATLRFTADETTQQNTSLTIKGEAADNADAYQGGALNFQNISGRPTTNNIVNWSPTPWDSAGKVYASPDITPIVQDIRGRSGWQNGNAMAFVIDGSGSRVATSFDGSSNEAPVLHIEYDYGPMPLPSLGPDRTICRGDTAHLSPGTGYSSYGWNGQENQVNPLIADTAGTYIANVWGGSNGLTYAEDTVDLSLLPLPQPSLVQDTLIEEGDSVLLHSQNNFAGYNWQTPGGQAINDSTWQASEQGTYSLQVTDTNGCTGRDTVVIDTFRVNNDTTITDTSDTTTTTATTLPKDMDYRLSNVPNPFSSSTMITFSIPKAKRVTLRIISIQGQEIKEVMSGRKEQGTHTVRFEANNLQTGIYLLQLQTPEYQTARKIMLRR